MTSSGRAWPWWRAGLLGLIVLGLALSAYLSWHHLVGGAVIGCGGGSGCQAVLDSRWSSIGGVLPVSGLAMGTYLALLVAVMFIGPRMAAADRKLAWSAMLILVGAAAGSAVWFIIVQKRIIGAFCPYCLAAHITGLLLAGLMLWQAPKAMSDAPADSATQTPAPSQRKVTRGGAFTRMTVGIALASALAMWQVASAPPAAYRAGEAQVARIEIDPRSAPLIGSPDAPYVVTLLFDYRCSHCQRLHSLLEQAIARYDRKLAFMLCPAPLNNKCNPYIARQVDEFKESCDLARVGLAVWLASRDAYAEFDHWMFQPDPAAPGQPWRGRNLDAARAKAVELIGKTKFDSASKDPRVDQLMESSVRIFGQTLGVDQSGNAVPKLVFGQRWVTPEPRDVEELLKVLQTNLTVPPP